MISPNNNPKSKLDKLRYYFSTRDLQSFEQDVRQYWRWRLQRAKQFQLNWPWLNREIEFSLAALGYTGEPQFEEARVLHALLRNHPHPYLVDVGAHDGRSLSNSRPFILRNWHALLLEPLPRVYNQLCHEHRNHPKAICLNIAASDQSGEEPLFLGKDGDIGMTSTLCRDANDWFDVNRSDESILVEIDTLTNILATHDRPADFGLLLIDAEGMDYEVLSGLDFSRYRPTVIVTEEYRSNPEKHAAKYQLLSNNGYILHVSLNGINTIWVERTYARQHQFAEIQNSVPDLS